MKDDGNVLTVPSPTTETRKLERLVWAITSHNQIEITQIKTFADAITAAVMRNSDKQEPQIIKVLEEYQKNGLEPPFLMVYVPMFELMFSNSDKSSIWLCEKIYNTLRRTYEVIPKRFNKDEEGILKIFDLIFSKINEYKSSASDLQPTKSKKTKLFYNNSLTYELESLVTEGVATSFKNLVLSQITGIVPDNSLNFVGNLSPELLDNDYVEHYNVIVIGEYQSSPVLRYLEVKLAERYNSNRELVLIDQKIEAVKRRIQSPHIGNFGFVISSIASALTAISSLLSIFYFQTGLWVGIYLAIFLIFTSVVVVGGWILAYVLDLDLNITSRFNILTLWLLFSFRNLRNENISLRYKKGAFRLFESD